MSTRSSTRASWLTPALLLIAGAGVTLAYIASGNGVRRYFRPADRGDLVPPVDRGDPLPFEAAGCLAECAVARARDVGTHGAQRVVHMARRRPRSPRCPRDGVRARGADVPCRARGRVPEPRGPGGPTRDRRRHRAAHRGDRDHPVPVPAAGEVDGIRVRRDGQSRPDGGHGFSGFGALALVLPHRAHIGLFIAVSAMCSALGAFRSSGSLGCSSWGSRASTCRSPSRRC